MGVFPFLFIQDAQFIKKTIDTKKTQNLTEIIKETQVNNLKTKQNKSEHKNVSQLFLFRSTTFTMQYSSVTHKLTFIIFICFLFIHVAQCRFLIPYKYLIFDYV
jgi:hypothetical protein